MLKERLEYAGAVLIEGPKWCGKTMTASQQAKSILDMQDEDNSDKYIKAADAQPSLLLDGDAPRLIDEWQMAPNLWNAVRHRIDKNSVPGQYILTGSYVPAKNQDRHSGAGRFSRLIMRPMTLFESGISTGAISIKDLFEGTAKVSGMSDLKIRDLAVALVKGGWPMYIDQNERICMLAIKDYLNTIAETDIARVNGIRRDPANVKLLMRSLARNVSSTASVSTIKKDMAGDTDTISERTVTSYISELRHLYIIEDVPAWNPSVRSKTSIRTAPKRNFVDPSLAVSALHMSSDMLMKDFNTFGLLFESLCVRDLRVYSQPIYGEVCHYRDSYDNEVDLVIALDDGRWAAVEVKMGDSEIEKAAVNLKKLRDTVDTAKMNEPSFLMVLTATGPAYVREDGICVIPIGCLRD
jgi:predicted AAA+ superfamily ATPase